MLHLASYVMMPFLAELSFAAPTQLSTSTQAQAHDLLSNGYISANSSNMPAAASVSPDRAGNTNLIASLTTAATAVDRLAILSDPSDHVYDFNQPPTAEAITLGLGGHTVKADRKEFPALIGNGVSMTVGFIGPCGFNTPHTHPRSAEINIVVQGSLGTEYILENGANMIRNRLNTMQMTVFPQGAIHTEFNPDCTNATFVAGFASEDPGVQQSAQRLLDLDDDLLKASFGGDITIDGRDIEKFRSLIPANVAKGVDSCLAKCGISKR